MTDAIQQPKMDARTRRRLTGMGLFARFATVELWLGLGLAAILILLALFGDALMTAAPGEGNLRARLKPPAFEAGGTTFWLGTDQLGRDQWSRLLAGLPWSLGVALLSTAIAAAIGTALGLLAAEAPGWTRTVINQVVDTVLSFPGLVIAICIVALAGRGFWPLTLTLGLLSWPVFTRVAYAEALSVMKREYVMAAQLLGAGRMAILAGHVLPALLPTLAVVFAFHFADMLIAESALSFLGIGAPLGTPSWGAMLSDSRQYLTTAPWMMLVPAGAIVLAVVTANLIGDGLVHLTRRRGRERG